MRSKKGTSDFAGESMCHHLLMKRFFVTLALCVLAPFTLSAQRSTGRPAAPAKAAAPPPPRAASPAPPRVERPAPFAVGETLTYNVSWSTYLTAGSVVTTVKEKRPSYNSTAYYIVAEARPTTLLSRLYSLYYKVDTLLDVFTLLPQRGSIYSEEGKRHRYRVTRFDRATSKVFFEFTTDHTVKADFATSPTTQDALSAIYALRAAPLKAGERVTLPISDNGGNLSAQFETGALERMKTRLGELNAWRVKLSLVDARNQPVGRNTAIWISDDQRRLPLKLQADLAVGSFVLLLRDVR